MKNDTSTDLWDLLVYCADTRASMILPQRCTTSEQASGQGTAQATTIRYRSALHTIDSEMKPCTLWGAKHGNDTTESQS